MSGKSSCIKCVSMNEQRHS